MTIETDPRDGSKLPVRMGFDGRCKGGGIGEAWASTLEAKPTVRVRDGRFSADAHGHRARPRRRQGPHRRVHVAAQRPLHRRGRRHRDRQRQRRRSATAGRKVISRCKIAKPASVAARTSRSLGGEVFRACPYEGMSVETATLLLVEDDPLIRTFLADNLTADGYELLVAATLEDALRELEFKRPDLAVVDLRLPGRLGPGAGPARAGGGRRRLAARPGAAAADALRLGLASSTASAASSAALDDYVVKPFAYPRAAAADRGGAAALAGARAARAAAGGGARDRPGRPRRRRCAGAGSSSRRRSSRCCGRSPRRRRACSPRRSCCATSGASGRAARRARWTPTPAACAQKLRARATSSSSTSGASATASSTARSRARPHDLHARELGADARVRRVLPARAPAARARRARVPRAARAAVRGRSSASTASAASPRGWPRSSSSWPAPAAPSTTSPPPLGRRARTRRELVDLTELVESYAPAWRTLARATAPSCASSRH